MFFINLLLCLLLSPVYRLDPIDIQPVPLEQELPEILTLAVVGDLMAHIDQVQYAWNPDSETYDFSPSFRYIKPFLSQADLAFGNLETTLAGPDGAFQKVANTYFQGYQGYPFFNSPDSYLDALTDAGFDILSLANNHSLDSGMEGAIRTRDQVLQKGMIPVGTQPSGEDGVEYLEVKGMKLAFLSYTFCTNQFREIESLGFRINSLNMYQEPLIEEMLQTVRKAADQSEFTVVMIHFGWSYIHRPDDWQISLTDRLLEAGADFVAGDHPHVLQPMSFRENGDGEESFQIYSLSNFISHQPFSGNPPVSKDGGVVLKLHLFEKDPGLVEILKMDYMPTWLKMTDGGFTVIPVDNALREPNAYGMVEEDYSRLYHLVEESPRILGGDSTIEYPYRTFPRP